MIACHKLIRLSYHLQGLLAIAVPSSFHLHSLPFYILLIVHFHIASAATINLWNLPPRLGPGFEGSLLNISGLDPDASIADVRSASATKVDQPAVHVAVAVSRANGASRLRSGLNMPSA